VGRTNRRNGVRTVQDGCRKEGGVLERIEINIKCIMMVRGWSPIRNPYWQKIRRNTRVVKYHRQITKIGKGIRQSSVGKGTQGKKGVYRKKKNPGLWSDQSNPS